VAKASVSAMEAGPISLRPWTGPFGGLPLCIVNGRLERKVRVQSVRKIAAANARRGRPAERLANGPTNDCHKRCMRMHPYDLELERGRRDFLQRGNGNVGADGGADGGSDGLGEAPDVRVVFRFDHDAGELFSAGVTKDNAAVLAERGIGFF